MRAVATGKKRGECRAKYTKGEKEKETAYSTVRYPLHTCARKYTVPVQGEFEFTMIKDPRVPGIGYRTYRYKFGVSTREKAEKKHSSALKLIQIHSNFEPSH